jgi:hypothetical protein
LARHIGLINREGSVGSYWYAKGPDTKLPMYEVEVSKDVPTLEAAVETIEWMRYAESETWV